MAHNPELIPGSAWQNGELSQASVDEIRRTADGQPLCGIVLNALAEGLEPGQSRTIFDLPFNKAGSRTYATISAAVRNLPQAVSASGGIDRLSEHSHVIRKDDISPEELAESFLDQNPGLKLASDIGYIRAARDQMGIVYKTTGALDSANRLHYIVDL